MLLTFLHHAPPPPGPVAELQGVALLYLGPLLEAADQLVAQPVAVVHPLHRPLVVPRLQAGDRFGEQGWRGCVQVSASFVHLLFKIKLRKKGMTQNPESEKRFDVVFFFLILALETDIEIFFVLFGFGFILKN